MGTSKELYDLNRVYFESVYQKEPIDEKMNAGLRAYLDKKKSGKTEDKEENGNGKNGKASKGSKPDFLDLDKDGNKTEPMKSAAKSKKNVKEGSAYGMTKGSGQPSGPMAAFGKAPRMQKGAMAYDGPNKEASEAKDRIMAKAKAKRQGMKEAMIVTNADKKANTPAYQNMKKGMKGKDGKPMYKAADHMKEATHSKDIQGYADAYNDVQEMSYGYMGGGMVKGYQGGGMVKKDTKKKGKKPVVHLDKPDKLVSMKIKESGIFSEEELAKLLWLEFDESIEENRQVAMEPEKHKDPDESDKPYSQRSKAARMRDPKRGINSPAFKKFMASQGM